MTKTNKAVLLRKYIEEIEDNLSRLRGILNDLESGENIDLSNVVFDRFEDKDKDQIEDGENRIIYGVFDGEKMVSEEGVFSIPPNYASKSKLVEGDSLKLTIKPDGSFIYKQTKPVKRKRLIGTLVKDKKSDKLRVIADNRLYKVLLASLTYFKAKVGDEVVILVPENSISTWAAVENVIKKNEDQLVNDTVLGV